LIYTNLGCHYDGRLCDELKDYSLKYPNVSGFGEGSEVRCKGEVEINWMSPGLIRREGMLNALNASRRGNRRAIKVESVVSCSTTPTRFVARKR